MLNRYTALGNLTKDPELVDFVRGTSSERGVREQDAPCIDTRG